MNIINAAFVRNGVTVRTLPVYQYNRGMILSISGLDDLPSTFRADFSNAETGQSKSVIGTDGEVHIPYEYFVPGATIHCWLVWTGEDYTVTRKHIMIPVARRATPTDEEPTPDEQGVIDQAIAALNDAVAQTGQDVESAAGYAEQAEQSAQAAATAKNNAVAAQNAAEAAKDQVVEYASNAAASAQSASESAQSALQSKADAQAAAVSVAGAMDTLEATIQADLQAAKESGEFDGADGVSPTVTVTPIIDGHQVMITDAEGEHTFDVTDGKNGLNGDPGADGFSPLATVTQTQTGAVITVTDKTGTTTATVTNGAKGDPGTPGADGFSPVATVTQTQTGATISITDKTGTTTAQISNGAKGDPGDDYVLTAQDKAEIAQQAAAEVDVPVQDVQMGGTSILNEGIANIPATGASRNGYCRIDNSYGVNANEYGRLYIQKATDADTKDGTNQFRPLVPYNQHFSVFYGLAKLAGADMASLSGETVGVYPEAQRVAIQKMLGIYEAPWELIREDEVTNATEADIEITVDGNGNPFELTDVRIEFYSPVQQTTFTKGGYGKIEVFYGSVSSNADRAFIGAYTQNANASARYSYVVIEQKDGMVTKTYMLNTSSGDNGQLRAYAQPTGMFYIGSRTYNKIVICKVTGTAHYKIYGKRKWQ